MSERRQQVSEYWTSYEDNLFQHKISNGSFIKEKLRVNMQTVTLSNIDVRSAAESRTERAGGPRQSNLRSGGDGDLAPWDTRTPGPDSAPGVQ